MSELKQAIKDTEADLEMADQVLRQRGEELETARQKVEKAQADRARIQKQLLKLLKAAAKDQP